MGFGQPHARIKDAVLRPPTQEGYGQSAFPFPPQQLPSAPTGVSLQGAPTSEPMRGVPTGLYHAAPPAAPAQTFPANSTYDRLQQAILQGAPLTPPPPPAPALPSDPAADPDYARMLDFIAQQTGGL